MEADGGQKGLAPAVASDISRWLDSHPATTLMGDITRLIGGVERELRVVLRTNTLDFQAMELLMREGPQSVGAMASRLGVSQSLAGVVVDRLQAVGHVVRVKDPKDRRRVIVQPSPSSTERIKRHLMPAIVSADTRLRSLSASDLAVIVAFLESWRDDLTTQVDQLRAVADHAVIGEPASSTD